MLQGREGESLVVSEGRMKGRAVVKGRLIMVTKPSVRLPISTFIDTSMYTPA